jgi:hypothetical protein
LDEAVVEEALNFIVAYDLSDNLITIRLIDFDEGLSVTIISNDDLIAGVNWEAQLFKDRIAALNGVLRIGKAIPLSAAKSIYTAYIDLHTTRFLYPTSSSLGNYNIISKFGNDVIIQNK